MELVLKFNRIKLTTTEVGSFWNEKWEWQTQALNLPPNKVKANNKNLIEL